MPPRLATRPAPGRPVARPGGGTPAPSPAAARLGARFLAAAREESALSRIRFRGAALEAQGITQHEWMLAGPAETGKTFSGLWRVYEEMARTAGSRWVLVRKVRADMGGTVLRTWDRVSGLRRKVEPYGGAHPEWYEMWNGSRLYVAGMDRPGKVLSGEYDGVYVNQAEELRLEDWETLSTRVTGRGAVTSTPMLCGDCNPGPPSHWILSRQALRVMHSRHEDNPTLFDDAGRITEQGRRTIDVLDALTGVRRERLRFGRWVAAEGTVYDAFDRAVHVIRPSMVPPFVRRIRAIDFGFTNPFVCLWIGVDADDRAYVYRQLYRTRRIVEDHAREILYLTGHERIDATVADHDAEDRATLLRHGVGTVAAQKEVGPGIEAVQARLRLAGDGRPRLFVVEGCLVERDEDLSGARKPVSIEEEFESYSWPKAADGKPVKEEPIKVDDHAMDALRYGVMFLPRSVATLQLGERPGASGPRSEWANPSGGYDEV